MYRKKKESDNGRSEKERQLNGKSRSKCLDSLVPILKTSESKMLRIQGVADAIFLPLVLFSARKAGSRKLPW